MQQHAYITVVFRANLWPLGDKRPGIPMKLLLLEMEINDSKSQFQNNWQVPATFKFDFFLDFLETFGFENLWKVDCDGR